MKKSLIISEDQKYGRKPNPTEPGVEVAKEKPRKFAPQITLTGAQVDAFCGCDMKVGDKGSATVHFIVKAASSGDQYGEEVPGKKADQKLTLSLTHVEADEKSVGKKKKDDIDDEEEDNSDEEKAESDSEEKSEGEVDEGDETGEGVAPSKLSPKDAGLDD